jgi:hypothetical protein
LGSEMRTNRQWTYGAGWSIAVGSLTGAQAEAGAH